MGVPRSELKNKPTNHDDFESMNNALFLTLTAFLKDKLSINIGKLKITAHPTHSATAVTFEIRVENSDDAVLFTTLGSSNSPLLAIGRMMEIEETQRAIFLEMDITR